MDSQLTPDRVREGMVLAYRGDDVPYVAARNLITKGQKKNTFLLPAFQADDAYPEGGIWLDLPGSKKDTYWIAKIERDRKGKNGRALPDMAWVKGEGYSPDVSFGLRFEDLCAKFELVEDPASDIEAEVDTEIKAGASTNDRRRAWDREKQESGW